jgi:uncharacterized protein involved in exopolysaccharide biosynthesis
MADEQDADDEGGSGPPPLEQLQSLAAFLGRSVRRRMLLTIGIFAVVATGVVAAVALWPRTYYCQMQLMVQRTQVLDPSDVDPLKGVTNLLLRHENLESIIKRVDLIHAWGAQRAPLLALKDRLSERLRGKKTDVQMLDMLVNTLSTKLNVEAQDGVLTVGVLWPNAQMAARIVEAAREVFMESRHAAEISQLQERIAIWEGHAMSVRGEIDGIAEQLQKLREDQVAKAQRVGAELASGTQTGAPQVTFVPRRSAAATADPDLPALREELETKKRRLAELEGDRNRRLTEAQSRLTDLKTRFTAEHPLVLDTEKTLAALANPTPAAVALRAEVKKLTDDVASREARPASAGGGGPARTASSKPSGAGATEPLPQHVLELLESGVGVDPVVGAQLSGALAKFSQLRESIGTARVSLDTAQAAFQHRYKIVQPTEVPLAPVKPVVPKMIGIGLLVAILLALLVPVLLELKTGLIVERWQVHRLALPILADLPLPLASRRRD